jgi:tetratricopeptide (TPR) repeat protein
MTKIKNFAEEAFRISIRYCGEEAIEELREIFHHAEKLEDDLITRSNKIPEDVFENPPQLKTLTYFDNLISYAKKRLREVDYLSYLEEVGELCINSGEMVFAKEVFDTLLFESSKNSRYTLLTAQCYLKRAEVFSIQARWKQAESDLSNAKKLFAFKKDKKGLARVSNLYGNLYAERGKIKLSKKHYEDALRVFTGVKDSLWIGTVEMNLGILETIRGSWDLAFAHFKRSLTAFEKLSELKRLAEIRHNMGMLFKNRGELDSALNELDRSLEYSFSANYLPTVGLALLAKGDIYTKFEDYTLAMEFCHKAMQIFYKIMDRLSLADAYKIKGIIQRDTSNHNIAESYFLTSLRINEENENLLNYAETSYEIGILYRKWKKSDLAVKYLKLAKKFFNLVGAKEEVAKVELVLEKT